LDRAELTPSGIATWSRGAGDEHMPSSLLAQLAPLVHRHPWWRARARLVRRLLASEGIAPPARVLDAGCGWGVTFRELERAGYRIAGLDVDRPALEQLDRERSGRELIEAELTREVPEGAGGYDAVLALDVIEHLDDDRAAVSRLAGLLRPGGLLILSVPALPELFTEFDEVQGHRRRYTPESLRGACVEAPLEGFRALWWGSWMVPLLRRQRSRSRAVAGESPQAVYARYLALPPWPAPLALGLAFALEAPRALAGKLRTGTSLFVVARRRGDAEAGSPPP
jgi:2-polyprenyl-3-methyl-5-hydroxy-6-metoxy-1,4-benzoquinol methylase